MTENIIGEKELKVLEYLKKQQDEIKDKDLIVAYYAVGAKDIIKYIERPDACLNWPFDFVCLTHRAVHLIAKNYLNINNTSNKDTADLVTKEKVKKKK